MGATSYKDLEVWNIATSLATDVYSVTGLMPRREEYRLIRPPTPVPDPNP
jgi:hypothetical protein